jgi:hypothetical protein
MNTRARSLLASLAVGTFDAVGGAPSAKVVFEHPVSE